MHVDTIELLNHCFRSLLSQPCTYKPHIVLEQGLSLEGDQVDGVAIAYLVVECMQKANRAELFFENEGALSV